MREIQRGEIYLADLGEGVGSEQKGVRPVLIVLSYAVDAPNCTVHEGDGQISGCDDTVYT